ncbi:tetratricopeptide repeat protein [Cochlodiniinecator piscidefendens]|uniref:tetratricopeptide repeat protein n=1 Tax=Cochlodiniinecator piscidefendens TaxID=2715756 RepID=UPI00140B2AAA|nr:tetratricopeptide repeat protein [Cochlodiniinecator piscidefendens]
MTGIFKALAVSMIALTTASQSVAQGNSGAYLAARHASFYSDFDAASLYFTRALSADPSNQNLLESAVTAYMGLGRFDTTLPVAQQLHMINADNQIANLALIAGALNADELDGFTAATGPEISVGPLVDGLLRAWAFAAEGQMSAAFDAFDLVIAEQSTAVFGLYHKALALASVGDFEGADEILSGAAAGPLPATRRSIMAHIQVLSQLDRNADALELLGATFAQERGNDVASLRAALEVGERIPFSVVSSASEGFAEVFHSVAAVLAQDAPANYTILYARISSYLRADFTDAHLLTANLLEDLQLYDLATDVYSEIPVDDPSYFIAAMGRANSLYQAGQGEAAIEALRALARSHSGLAIVHSTLGDFLRRDDLFEESVAAYDSAIALYGTPEPNQWRTYYARGVSYERLGDWEASEENLRAALELSPGQPYVLNYLGYSLVEKQEKLDEALSMIEQAVAARPDDGFIIDSLGWVYYRLGRFDEAVAPMERAVELAPLDPILNDHLGDVLWVVGRHREAEFQWRRALSFEPAEEDAGRIRRKLEVGLDEVLAEEENGDLVISGDE